jgi:hypothetical protein
MRAPQDKALRAFSSPTSGARCDSRGGKVRSKKDLNLRSEQRITDNPEQPDNEIVFLCSLCVFAANDS